MAPGLTLENWNVGLLELSWVERPSLRSCRSARNCVEPWTMGEKLVPRSSQMTAREFSLFVREQSCTPGSWSRLVIWNTQGAPSPSKLAPVHVTRPKSAGVLIREVEKS